MKYLFSTLIFLVISISAYSQKAMDSGYIKMEVTEATAEDEQMAMGANMLKGSETEYWFDKDKTLVKQNMMGGMVSTTSLFHTASEKMDLYFDMMGQKMFIETSRAEMKSNVDSLQQVDPMKNMVVTYDEKDTKTILGHECFKASISNTQNTSLKMQLYISNQVKANPDMIQGLSDIELKGFPLEMSMEIQGMKIVYTTTELKDDLNQDVFKIDATGFKKLTFQEFQRTIGQMGGGGLGF